MERSYNARELAYKLEDKMEVLLRVVEKDLSIGGKKFDIFVVSIPKLNISFYLDYPKEWTEEEKIYFTKEYIKDKIQEKTSIIQDALTDMIYYEVDALAKSHNVI